MMESTACSSDFIHVIQIDELTCLRVNHPKASALIALQGAQVLEYTPAGAHPVLWLSETAGFKRGQSVRGGIPVCWPWFGDLRRNPAAVQSGIPCEQPPAHGWVRNLPWLLEQASGDEHGVSLRLRYPLPAGVPTAWAAQASLSLSLQIGSELVIQLENSNLGTQPLTLSQALHTYFAVSHIDHIHIDPLQNVRYIDTLRDWQTFSDSDTLRITQETDRIYLDTPPTLTIDDSGWQRRIHLHCSHSRSAVVWNPWIEKAKRLSHFAEDAYKRMLCIETARVMEDCLALAPGQTDTTTVRIWNSRL